MSFGAIALGTAILGTVISAQSQKQAGQAGAAIKQQESQFQLDKAALEEERFRFQIPRALGTQRAVLAKSGRPIGTGTGLDLLVESAGELELDALIVRAGGEIASSSALSEASLLETRGRNQAISTLLTGGFNIARSLS